MDLSEHANRFVHNSKNGWDDLVQIAVQTQFRELHHASKVLAKAAGIGAPTLKRKLQSIHAALAEGMTPEEITTRGQEAIVGRFLAAAKHKRYEPIVKMGFMVSPAINLAFRQEAWRIANVLGIRTQEHFFEWLVSQMVQWTPEELLHAAGEGHGDTRHKRGT